MEPAKHFLALYHRMRLTVYRRLLHRTGRLSAADAIAADVIYLLERPTLPQFAGEMGISQPSATYRVNELAQKGVIEKIPSPRDKRECRLQVGDDYRRKTLEAPGRIERLLGQLCSRFTPQQLDTTAAVLDAATGQRTVLAENLPTTTAEYEANYSVARYHDGWLLTVDEWGRGSDGMGTGDGTSAQYFCDGSGQMTLIPQKRYAEGKGVQDIQILDIQNGQVLVIYDEQIDTRQGIDKSGTAYTYTPVWRLYGVMPLEDLLAGSIDFTPLQFIS